MFGVTFEEVMMRVNVRTDIEILLDRNPDDLVIVVPLVHHPEEGAEQEDEDQVEGEGEEEEPPGAQPFLLDESCNDGMSQDWTGPFPGQVHQVLHKDQAPGVLVDKEIVVDDNMIVIIIDILARGGDTGVQLIDHELVPICHDGQEMVEQRPGREAGESGS